MSIICKYKKLNSYYIMFQEILLSYSRRNSNDFYDRMKDIPEREAAHLLQNYDLDKIEKVIIVGSGAIPYTAIFFAEIIKKPIYLIEKNFWAAFACSKLLRRFNLDNIKVIRGLGQCYRNYFNTLVIISLHTVSKQNVLKQILSFKGSNNIIIIRHPLESNAHLYERVLLNGMKYTRVKHVHELESIVLSKSR